MNAMTERRARASASFVHADGEVLHPARLLRMFDGLRTDLAMACQGRRGSGAGYDALRIDSSALEQVGVGDVVTVTGIVSSTAARGQLVDYIATASNNRGERAVLVQAHGWTLLPHQGSDSPADIDRRAEVTTS